MIEAREWEGWSGRGWRRKATAKRNGKEAEHAARKMEDKKRASKEKERRTRTRIKTTQRAKLRCVGAQGFPAFFLDSEGAG